MLCYDMLCYAMLCYTIYLLSTQVPSTWCQVLSTAGSPKSFGAQTPKTIQAYLQEVKGWMQDLDGLGEAVVTHLDQAKTTSTF